MGKILFILAMTLTSLLSNAAKPVEVEIDQIFYRLDLDEMTASVINAKEGIKSANILSEIEYQGQTYSVTNIGGAALYRQYSLVSVNIPNSIVTIGGRAFESCRYLKFLDIPNSVKIIEPSAFEMCRGLESIILPPSLKEVGESAFRLCEKLTKVYISDLDAWCKIEFGYGGTASPFYETKASLYLNDKLVEDLIFSDNITAVKAWSFYGCGSITSVSTPNTVREIGRYAFGGCDKLKTVSLSKSTERIDWGAFSDCKSLETINLYAIIPPTLEVAGREYNQFLGSYPEYMILHVPHGTKETYEKTDGWKDFGTIIEDLPNESGIENILIDNTRPIEIYNLEGECVFSGIGNYELKSGFYIIRQGPKCKKIIIE